MFSFQVCAMGALLAILHRDGLLRSVHGLTSPHSTISSPQVRANLPWEADAKPPGKPI